MTIQSIRDELKGLSDEQLRRLAAAWNDGVVPPEVEAALGPGPAAPLVVNREITLTPEELRILSAGLDGAALTDPEQVILRTIRSRLGALA